MFTGGTHHKYAIYVCILCYLVGLVKFYDWIMWYVTVENDSTVFTHYVYIVTAVIVFIFNHNYAGGNDEKC